MERYIKQIVDDVMEMAAKIQFLEAKLAAAESWNAEQLADAQATVEAAISDRDKQQDISKALYQQVEALQREHDKFFDLQCPKAPPSCLICGQVKEFSIKHLILGSVGICRDCVSLQAALDAERGDRDEQAICE